MHSILGASLYVIQTDRPAADPVVSYVDRLLVDALKARSSDIHLEPAHDQLTVRIRVDGLLMPLPAVGNEMRSAVLARLKILADLDGAQQRLPQDGKIALRIQTAEGSTRVDVRIATFPTVFGEKMVIRFLPAYMNSMTFAQLGMSKRMCDDIARMKQQHGLFLVTGPTGAGKTTTLYRLLCMQSNSTRNSVTLEDPVECFLPGVTQTQIQPRHGLTFEDGLRSLLRQDPDVIMVGEMRDAATVRIAFQAAMTGHLVLSSLHTRSAVATLTRLHEMGVERYVREQCLIGVVAQRLVRKLCMQCRLSVELRDQVAEQYAGLEKNVWEARGCHTCLHQGYVGRIGIFEMLNWQQLQEGQEPTQSLFQDGIEKVNAGVTSLDEVLRVAGE